MELLSVVVSEFMQCKTTSDNGANSCLDCNYSDYTRLMSLGLTLQHKPETHQAGVNDSKYSLATVTVEWFFMPRSDI